MHLEFKYVLNVDTLNHEKKKVHICAAVKSGYDTHMLLEFIYGVEKRSLFFESQRKSMVSDELTSLSSARGVGALEGTAVETDGARLGGITRESILRLGVRSNEFCKANNL